LEERLRRDTFLLLQESLLLDLRPPFWRRRLLRLAERLRLLLTLKLIFFILYINILILNEKIKNKIK